MISRSEQEKYLRLLLNILNTSDVKDIDDEYENAQEAPEDEPSPAPLNIFTDDEETLYIEIALPGIAKENINIELDEDVLYIYSSALLEDLTGFTTYSEEFEIESTTTKIKLQQPYVDSVLNDEIVSDYSDGVLMIDIPFTKGINTTKSIEIN